MEMEKIQKNEVIEEEINKKKCVVLVGSVNQIVVSDNTLWITPVSTSLMNSMVAFNWAM